VEQRRAADRVRLDGLTPLLDQPLEAADVHLVGADVEPVAMGGGHEHARRALLPLRLERLAQGGDLGAQRARRLLRRGLPPERGGETVGRDHLVRVQQQGAEQGSLPGTPQGEPVLPVPHLEGAENPELHLLAHHPLLLRT
jgi:hypothetical protein